jgi:hypothetical protein
VTGPVGPEWIGSFGFEPSRSERPSAGGGVTAAHLIDESTLGAKFLQRLEQKANRRKALPAEYQHSPFLIAVRNQQSELRPLTVLSTLTGPRCYSPPPKLAPLVPRFEAAGVSGWMPLLEEWGYVGTSAMVFPHYGAFGDESLQWSKEISGVLVLHDSDTLLQWLPNPFAAPPRADPRLLQPGFPFSMLGASCPVRPA